MNPHLKLVGFGTSNKVKNHWSRVLLDRIRTEVGKVCPTANAHFLPKEAGLHVKWADKWLAAKPTNG